MKTYVIYLLYDHEGYLVDTPVYYAEKHGRGDNIKPRGGDWHCFVLRNKWPTILDIALAKAKVKN